VDIAKLKAGVTTAVEEMRADMEGLKHSIDSARDDAARMAQATMAASLPVSEDRTRESAPAASAPPKTPEEQPGE
jgi:hypothetical protein